MGDLLNHAPNNPAALLPSSHPFHVATHSYYAILASSFSWVSLTNRTLPSLLLLSTPWLLECKQRTKLHHHSPLP